MSDLAALLPPSQRARDESLVQAQLAAAMQGALRATLGEPLPDDVLRLLDRLAERARREEEARPL